VQTQRKRPTCAGYNWEINGDTGHRTTFHCDSFKLEVKASCLLEWKRLQRQLISIELRSCEETLKAKTRINTIDEFLSIPI